MMCICNAGKENLHVHHRLSPSQPQPPHADLSTILSQLVKNLAQEQLETFLTDPVIVDKVSQHLNGRQVSNVQGFHVTKFHFLHGCAGRLIPYGEQKLGVAYNYGQWPGY